MQTSPPPVLERYFKENFSRPDFHVRRRAALIESEPYGKVLACCVVEAFSGSDLPERALEPRLYDKASFYEDWLNQDQCAEFIQKVQKGDTLFSDVAVIRASPAQWVVQSVPLANMYMSKPGVVVSCAIESRALQLPQDPMLSISEPYFPGAADAIRDWTGLTLYNGQSDSRNGTAIFLLPELRAFLTRAISENGALSFEIGGFESKKRAFVVKGAYWLDQRLNHFECSVIDGRGTASVPDYPDRLDYVLLDEGGTLYDFQQEHAGKHTGIVRQHISSVDMTLASAIRDATLQGEGQNIEFKPFVDPHDQLGPVHNRTKLGQIIQSIVAFSNSAGGRIFIGVDDTCGLNGVEPLLRAWGKEATSDALYERYRGALTNKIRGAISGDVSIVVNFAMIDEHLIAVIHVQEANSKPLEIVGDSYYYVRAGASNRKLSPKEWTRAGS